MKKLIKESLDQDLTYEVVVYDYRDPGESIARDFEIALKHFGIYVTKNPAVEDTDMLSYILSDRKLSLDEIEEIAENNS